MSLNRINFDLTAAEVERALEEAALGPRRNRGRLVSCPLCRGVGYSCSSRPCVVCSGTGLILHEERHHAQ